jgi:hypothetical protein
VGAAGLRLDGWCPAVGRREVRWLVGMGRV